MSLHNIDIPQWCAESENKIENIYYTSAIITHSTIHCHFHVPPIDAICLGQEPDSHKTI